MQHEIIILNICIYVGIEKSSIIKVIWPIDKIDLKRVMKQTAYYK